MKIKPVLQLLAVTLAAVLCVSTVNAKHHEEAEYLIEDLEDCDADAATMKKAKEFIAKHGGKLTEKQADDFIDSLPDDLIDCIDDLD